MQPTVSSRPCAILLAVGSAVALLVVAATAGAGAATQETPANNTTVQHERPDEVSAAGDSEQVRRWLNRRLARQLGESAVTISEGEYEQGRRVLGDEYTSRLDQYVSVAGETESGPENRTTEAYREAQRAQREYANATKAYRETYETYERARRNGNTTKARQAARELETLAGRIRGLNASLQRDYETVGNQTDVDTGRPRAALANTTSNVSSQQTSVREQTFVETTLTARTNASAVSFARPVTVSGRLRLANGTALSNVTGSVAVGGRNYSVTTDSDGRFALRYRPVSLPANATGVSVRFRPAAASVYLGANDTVTVDVARVSPRVELTDAETTGGYGDQLTTTAVVTVDGRPVPSLPIRARLGDTVVSGRTDDSGRVTLSPRVPVGLASGNRTLRLAHDRSGLAVGPTTTTETVRISERRTALTR